MHVDLLEKAKTDKLNSHLQWHIFIFYRFNYFINFFRDKYIFILKSNTSEYNFFASSYEKCNNISCPFFSVSFKIVMRSWHQ